MTTTILLATPDDCCACGEPTAATVTFIGSALIVHIPCCEGCQSSLTIDVRWCLVMAAWERQQTRLERTHQAH